MSNYPVPVKIVHTPTKTTSITIRFNNGEINEGIEALRAFCESVIHDSRSTPENNSIADAMLKIYAIQKEGAK